MSTIIYTSRIILEIFLKHQQSFIIELGYHLLILIISISGALSVIISFSVMITILKTCPDNAIQMLSHIYHLSAQLILKFFQPSSMCDELNEPSNFVSTTCVLITSTFKNV